MQTRITVLITFLTCFLLTAHSQVSVTRGTLTIPSYQVMDPDPNPVFFNGRRYQGAKGVVYPYPLIHNLTDSLEDKDYQSVIIENEFIEVCILPELGGRIYYARDKRNDYFFLYYNRVIKPALIGMTGAWISGGVEWNIPHHHRASSFMPVDHSITENPDGSSTVWVGETELRHGSKWIVGVTLHPGSILIEITVRVFNTTPYQNSILAWANAAVHTNTDYQVFFPPLTRYVTYHRKNQFSEWPVSRQHYDGADYTLGVDVSRWENHIKPTSFFEWGNNGNFVAGIDHAQQAGTVIFGNKYKNPGKKMWSWGNNPYGAMWEGLLTDEDGPYIELMFGSFSDNQPDYSWIQTRETRESRYWFAPLSGMNGIKEVNEYAMADIEMQDDSLFVVINAARALDNTEILIYYGDSLIHREQADLDPHMPYRLELMHNPENSDLQAGHNEEDNPDYGNGNIGIVLNDYRGTAILEYRDVKPPQETMPRPVSSPLSAGQLNDPDSLYYAGLRFEQFHDPHFLPGDYYMKALDIKPDHVPSLTRSGILFLRAGDYEKAVRSLADAADRVTEDYTVPRDASPLYHLALAYLETGRERDAYELFAMAARDYNFRSASGYKLALLDSRRGNYHSAMEHLRYARYTNNRSPDILALMASMQRLSGRENEALESLEGLLAIDPLSLQAHYEKFLLSGDDADIRRFDTLMRNYHENYLQLAVNYGSAGLYSEAIDLLEHYLKLPDQSLKGYPMMYYYLGFYNHISGNTDKAGEYFKIASDSDYKYCFPFRHESLRVLETALEYDHEDALAWYLTGNIYYDHQPRMAVEAWENAVSISDSIAIAHRNLAFAYANIDNDPGSAIKNIEQAIRLYPDDPRYYYEYDLYRKATLVPPAGRLESFSANHDVVVSDQLSIFPYAALLTVTGNYNDAIELMGNHHFHRWEGGESIYLYWLYAHLYKAVTALESNLTVETRLLLDAALSYPENLQSVTSSHENIAYYFKGLLAERLNNPSEAEAYFMQAVRCSSGAPECDYFAALAYEKLKRKMAAESIFRYMVEGGQEELLAGEDLDFFDPFASARTGHDIQATAYFRIALGYKGMGDEENAGKYFKRAREHNPALMSLVFRE
jgi:tetratricopeptide (TPR) repeat protein